MSMRLTIASAAAALVLVAAGCGSDDDSSDDEGSAANASSSLATFEQAAKEAEQPTTDETPKDGPAPTKGKSVAVVVCAAVAEGCVRIGNGAKEAAGAIGWDVNVLDGGGEASKIRGAMLQAISTGADGLLLAAIDTKTVGDAMARAREAGIPVVSVVGGNTAGTSGTDVFAEPDARAEQAGEMLGNWLVTDTQGEAKIAMFHAPEFTDSRKRYEGSKRIFDSCSGCEIVEDTKYTASTAAKEIPLQIKSVLQANPDIDAVWIDIGGYGALGVQAIKELGLADKVQLVSFDCNLQDLKNIRDGNVQKACLGLGLEAGGWAGIDELNRAFDDAEPAEEYLPIRVITKDSLPAAGKAWEGDFDFRSAYTQLWSSAR